MKKVFLVLLSFYFVIVMSACNNENDVEKLTVTFDFDNGAPVLTVLVFKGHPLGDEFPKTPVKVGFEFISFIKRDGDMIVDEDTIINESLDLIARYIELAPLPDLGLGDITVNPNENYTWNNVFDTSLITNNFDNVYSEYYNNINLVNKTGYDLTNVLRPLVSAQSALSYDTARANLLLSDIDQTYPQFLRGAYNGRLLRNYWDQGVTWNREHIWPQSKLNGAAVGEHHNLRASQTSINSLRGNHRFVQGNGVAGLVGNDGFWPGDFDKGDVARISMFMVLKYSQLNLSANIDLADALLWNAQDPVDSFEKNRNDVFQNLGQGRNPFIDIPNLANLIYFDQVRAMNRKLDGYLLSINGSLINYNEVLNINASYFLKTLEERFPLIINQFLDYKQDLEV